MQELTTITTAEVVQRFHQAAAHQTTANQDLAAVKMIAAVDFLAIQHHAANGVTTHLLILVADATQDAAVVS